MKKVLLYLLVAAAAFLIGAAAQSAAARTSARARAPIENVAVVVPPLIENAQNIETSCEESIAKPEIKYPKSEVVFDYNFKKFDPVGTYYPLRRLPYTLREFESIEIGGDYGDENHGNVYVDVAGTGNYNAAYTSFGTVTNRRVKLRFVADSSELDEFRFEGEFLRQGNVWNAADNVPVLRGTLQRFSNKQKVAEATVEFAIESGGC